MRERAIREQIVRIQGYREIVRDKMAKHATQFHVRERECARVHQITNDWTAREIHLSVQCKKKERERVGHSYTRE